MVVIGIHRTGKTTFPGQNLGARIAAGSPREALLITLDAMAPTEALPKPIRWVPAIEWLLDKDIV